MTMPLSSCNLQSVYISNISKKLLSNDNTIVESQRLKSNETNAIKTNAIKDDNKVIM